MPLLLSAIALIVAVAAYVGYRGLWDNRDLAKFTTTLERLEQVLDRVESKTYVVAADVVTAQRHSEELATNLAVAKTAVETVASDLAAAQQRADTVVDGDPGEAADAGAQSEKP